MESKIRFDNKLIWIKFVLAFSIVVLHVINFSPAFHANNWCIQAMWNGISNIAKIAVPCFFAISGFLFYYNFSWDKLKGKWLRRVASLIIPFVIWNTIIYIYYFFISRVPVFEMESVNFTIKDFLLAIFNSINSPLWFIRTLVVYIIISPLLIKLWRNKAVGLLMIIALVCTNYMGISTPIVSNYYLPMYLLGAYIALYSPNLVLNRGGVYLKCFGILGMAFVVIISFIYNPLDLDTRWLFTLRLVGVVSFWFFFDIFSFTKKPNRYLNCSFIIYLMHCIIVKTLKLFTHYFISQSTIMMIIETVVYPILTVALIICVSVLLEKNRITCHVWAVMIGKRSQHGFK